MILGIMSIMCCCDIHFTWISVSCCNYFLSFHQQKLPFNGWITFFFCQNQWSNSRKTSFSFYNEINGSSIMNIFLFFCWERFRKACSEKCKKCKKNVSLVYHEMRCYLCPSCYESCVKCILLFWIINLLNEPLIRMVMTKFNWIASCRCNILQKQWCD